MPVAKHADQVYFHVYFSSSIWLVLSFFFTNNINLKFNFTLPGSPRSLGLVMVVTTACQSLNYTRLSQNVQKVDIESMKCQHSSSFVVQSTVVNTGALCYPTTPRPH